MHDFTNLADEELFSSYRIVREYGPPITNNRLHRSLAVEVTRRVHGVTPDWSYCVKLEEG